MEVGAKCSWHVMAVYSEKGASQAAFSPVLV